MSELEQASAEITRLKAELYDLISNSTKQLKDAHAAYSSLISRMVSVLDVTLGGKTPSSIDEIHKALTELEATKADV
jgi:hypothetical protein